MKRNDGFYEYLRAWGRNVAIDAGLTGDVPVMPTPEQTAFLRRMHDAGVAVVPFATA